MCTIILSLYIVIWARNGQVVEHSCHKGHEWTTDNNAEHTGDGQN